MLLFCSYNEGKSDEGGRYRPVAVYGKLMANLEIERAVTYRPSRASPQTRLQGIRTDGLGQSK